MILALGAEAIGDAPLEDVIAACERRGLGAFCLEVRAIETLQRAHKALPGHDIVIAAFRLTSFDDVAPETAARASAAFDCPLLIDANTPRAWFHAYLAARGTVAEPVVLDPQLYNVAEELRRATSTHGLPSHIILRGGGPEAAQFEGRGIGSLMTRLTLASYRGFLIIAPSGRATRHLWRTWLFSRRNWGCGSKSSQPSLVEIL